MQVLVDFYTKHAYFAIPMTLMTLTAVTLVIWRILLNRNARTNMNEFLPALQDKLEKEGVEAAAKFCKDEPGVIPQKLFAPGLEASKSGLAAMRRTMANAIEFEILPDLNFLLPSILAIAKIATMVGLLGTVISMIGTFQEMAVMRSTPGGGMDRQAGEIGLALAATAMGLVTAIPLVFAHVLFKAGVGDFETKMKSAAQKLILLVQSARPGADARPVADSAAARRG